MALVEDGVVVFMELAFVCTSPCQPCLMGSHTHVRPRYTFTHPFEDDSSERSIVGYWALWNESLSDQAKTMQDLFSIKKGQTAMLMG